MYLLVDQKYNTFYNKKTICSVFFSKYVVQYIFSFLIDSLKQKEHQHNVADVLQ